MADYWKSQPKKFCQYCKCWIADNKPSVEFHERGKSHKQNVAAKIEEIKKKSIDKAKKDEKQSKEFAAMEDAAMKAYEEDMKRLQAESGTSEPEPQIKVEQPKEQNKTQKGKSNVKTDSSSESGAWVESLSDDGHVYYYNTVTGESQWDKPQGFQGQSQSKQPTESGSAWMEALSPDGYTYYYNSETGESSWEKPAGFSSEGSNSAESTAPGEAEKEPSPPKPESLSGDENSSNSAKASAESDEPKQQTKIPKISFRKRKEEKPDTPGEEDTEEAVKEESEDAEAAQKEEGKEKEDSGDASGPDAAKMEEEEKEEEEEAEEVPAKKPRKPNPYGAWEQIQEEEDPYENVDLQLPQVDTGDAAAAPTEFPAEPKPKFRERTITSLGDEGDAGATFRKRKTENGKSRSLRKRGKDN